MIGDRVEILVDVGREVRQFEIAATKAGRRVTVSTHGGIVQVSEVTRSGKAVRHGRFMSDRVVAVVEHPAGSAESRSVTALAPVHQRLAKSQSDE